MFQNHPIALLLQAGGKGNGDGYRSVPAPGAANAHHQLVLAFPNVMRNQKAHHIVQAFQKGNGCFVVKYIASDTLVKSCKGLEFFFVEWIWQKTHIKKQI